MDPNYLDPKKESDKKLTKRPNFFPDPIDSEQFFKDKAKERGLDTPKTPSRSQMIVDKDTQNRFNNPNQPTQLGNINSTDALTLSLINPAGLARTGFNLSKNIPSIMQRVLQRGKKLAFNFADDAVNVISSLGQSN